MTAIVNTAFEVVCVDPQGAAEGRERRERIGLIALKEKWGTVSTMRNGKRKMRIYEWK
jgi:hypothetical protein